MPLLERCWGPNPKFTSRFEETIDRGRCSWRSTQLTRLVKDIDKYLTYSTTAGFNRLKTDFDTWRFEDPKEFANRFASQADDFCAELGEESNAGDVDTNDEGGFGMPPAAADNPHRGRVTSMLREPVAQKKPRHYVPRDVIEKKGEMLDRTMEKIPDAAEVGLTGYEVGAAVAQHTLVAGLKLLGLGGKVAALAAPAAAAAEIGLGAAGLAITAATSGFAIRSGLRTRKHLLYLKSILKRRGNRGFRCQHLTVGRGFPDLPHAGDPSDFDHRVHNLILDQVLPYIIEQKESKEARKIATELTMGLFVTLYSALKRLKKGRGVKRYKAAHWLAYHFCTCHCQLAMHIVAALTGVEKMAWLLDNGDYEGIADMLAEKMATT